MFGSSIEEGQTNDDTDDVHVDPTRSSQRRNGNLTTQQRETQK